MTARTLEYRRGVVLSRRTISLAGGAIIEEEGTSVAVTCGVATVDLPHWRREEDRIAVDPDVRNLMRPGDRIDPVGLLSLLTFGMCVPPFTLAKEIGAFVPGMRTTIDLRDLSIRESIAPRWSPLRSEDPSLDPEAQCDAVLAALDDALLRSIGDRQPVLLFSGGVDSGLLAARLAALGRRDARLVHYRFSDDAPDTIAARVVAERLGFEFATVDPKPGAALEVLDTAPMRHRRPFADHSTIPTTTLLDGALAMIRAPSTILDGTGADGAFGMFAKAETYDRVERLLPAPLRRLLAMPYRLGGFWRRTGRLEVPLRLLRRAGTLPPIAAAIAISPMLGIGVHGDRSVVATLGAAVDDWSRRLAPPDGPPVRLPLADLCFICAGLFAQKDFSAAADAGIPIAYPFLDDQMIDLALRRASRWPGREHPKRVLKRLLLRDVPAETVERRKSGFVAPTFDLFRDEGMLARLSAVADPGAKLAPFIDPRVLRRCIDDLRAGHAFAPPIHNWLWALLIAERWLDRMTAPPT
jgi:asparagine synthetase B (glutamine-hydrolysing)